jgi:ABC-2 type transport system ATP-binding protein
MDKTVIKTENLTKRFDTTLALNGLNLQIFPGEIYGLLGPNGAGKTTALKAILGLIQPTSGNISINGFDPVTQSIDVKSMVGYVAEKPILYESLSARDLLEFVASIRKIDSVVLNRKIEKLGEAFEIGDYFDSPIATLSTGMKQKIAIISSLIHQPLVLLLDEPLSGLDAKSSRIVKDLLVMHTQKGGSVLFSTHIMEVAENICTRIGIIDKGKIIAEGTLDQLRSKSSNSKKSLEEIFLALTNNEYDLEKRNRLLVELFCSHEIN